MAKIVYNACFGGFGLSEQAVLRYCEIKGLRCFPEGDRPWRRTYWLVPPEERTGILVGDDWCGISIEARAESNVRYRELTLGPSRLERDDPVLVQVVEELGEAANGSFAKLRIEEVPAGTRYRIDEYDGNESVMTIDDFDWFVAS